MVPPSSTLRKPRTTNLPKTIATNATMAIIIHLPVVIFTFQIVIFITIYSIIELGGSYNCNSWEKL